MKKVYDALVVIWVVLIIAFLVGLMVGPWWLKVVLGFTQVAMFGVVFTFVIASVSSKKNRVNLSGRAVGIYTDRYIRVSYKKNRVRHWCNKPIVTFIAQDGLEYEVISSMVVGEYVPMAGDRVIVAYDPENPENARIVKDRHVNKFWKEFVIMASLILGLMVIFFIILFGVVIWLY